MVNAINKIKEMQKKINIINCNIDEIKNERKSIEENNKLDDYSFDYNIEKNFYFNNPKRNKSNRIHRNSSKFKDFKFNQTCKGNQKIFENNSKYNNDIKPNNNKIKEKNMIENYGNKKNNKSKMKRTCSSLTNIKCNNNNNNKRKNQTKNYFYQKSNNNYYDNYSKNNACNLKNKFIHSSNINENFIIKNSFNKNNKANDLNLLTTTKKNIKLKNFFNDCNNNKNNIIPQITDKDNSNNNRDIFYSGIYNNYIEFNPKNRDDNRIYKIYSKNNLYSNIEDEKVKEKNYSFHDLNNINSNNEYNINNLIKNKKNTPKNAKMGIYRNMSYNKNIKKKPYMPEQINNIKKNHIKKKNDINYEQIVLDLIDITNEYNKTSKININNIIDEYKILLRNIKIKEKFYSKLINKYNDTNKIKLNYDDPKSLISIWNWINQNYSNNINCEDMQYVQFCKEIMKKYKLNNIQNLKDFMNKLLKKIDCNDNFLEGIKKILSV